MVRRRQRSTASPPTRVRRLDRGPRSLFGPARHRPRANTTTTEAAAAALAVADRIGVSSTSVPPETPILGSRRFNGSGEFRRRSARSRAAPTCLSSGGRSGRHPPPGTGSGTQPRPGGRFVPEGRPSGRTVIVVDDESTATAERADHFLQIAAGAQVETLWTLRALVPRIALDAARVEPATGVSLERTPRPLRSASIRPIWCMVHRRDLGPKPWRVRCRGGRAGVGSGFERIHSVRDPQPRGTGQCGGAEAALTWQTGFASSVSLARGPRILTGSDLARTLLGRGEPTPALIVADPIRLSVSIAAAT